MTISKHTLDQLIRAKIAGLAECRGAQPLPVQWRPRHGNGHGNGKVASAVGNGKRVGDACNWVLPGFVGDEGAIRHCRLRLEHYLDLLRTEFDIPEDA